MFKVPNHEPIPQDILDMRFEEEEEECREQLKRDMINDKRLQKHLKKRMTPVEHQVIDFLECMGWVQLIEIVKFEKVTGSKTKSVEFFGESCKIRHLWDDTSSCSYSDTFGGSVFIPLGGGDYLHAFVSG